MFQTLFGLVGIELRITARRAAITALLIGLGGVLLAFTLGGLLVAAFIALADAYGPIEAALLIAAGAFLVGAILLVLGFLRLKRPVARTASPLGGLAAMVMPRASVAPDSMSARMASGAAVPPVTPVGSRRGPLKVTTVVGITVGALIAGVALGRRI
ncbi:phage holin family protein [Ancylobacter sp. 6x-1]|uniref:Phage holin family protein n=1 Tax=Ancylobacter crimeensis TaxID=2579147 RepID=A0ABT0DDI0_9HYPH|nr:phage holin family protein [Ancylobacter crimeensis]MCK0198025.1 phage holin family protein [Ancylobacter crimeensis]